MGSSNLQNVQAGDTTSGNQASQQLFTPRSAAVPLKILVKAVLLGAAAGMVLPLVAITFKIIGCHYGLGQIGDIISVLGMCGLPPLIVGAGITAAGCSIGAAAGKRADARTSSGNRASRSGWIGTIIGMVISLILSALPALMVMFPDC